MGKIFFTEGSVNVRSSPQKIDTNIIETLPPGHPVEVQEAAGNDWYSIRTAHANTIIRGYIAESLLRSSGGWEVPAFVKADMPLRSEILLDEESTKLGAYLGVRPPDPEARGAEALTVRRSRRLDLDWAMLLSPNLTAGYPKGGKPAFRQGDDLTYFVRHILTVWGLRGSGADIRFTANQSRICFEETVCVPDVNYRFYANSAPDVFRWGGFLLKKREATWSPGTREWVLSHPVANRLYKIVPRQGLTLTAADFKALSDFKKTLAEKVERFDLCVLESETGVGKKYENSSEHLLTDLEQVDLGPALILRQDGELNALEKFTGELSKAADTFGINSATSLMDESQVNALLRAVLTMKAPDVDRKLRKNELKDKAAALGYIIAESNEQWKFEDNSIDQVVAGRLYRPFNDRISWITAHTRTGTRSSSGFFGIGASSSTYEWTEYVKHEKWVVKHDVIAVDLDPFAQRERSLSAAGFTSYRFERVGSSYLTAEGDSLEDVMLRCENDENFRRSCAVWLPIYEQKISKGLMLTKYLIVKRPHMGIKPVRLPKLYVEEGLSYRTQWQNSELGELVYTINLAPGEERSVTVEQRSTRSVDESRSTVSVLDLTETTQNDLNSEIEKEARSTSEQSSSNSWSASASGTFKGITGSLSSSSNSSMSSSQFARSFERIARKAASSIARNTRQEVRSSVSVKTETSRTEATTIRIKNINDGRTLNLLFYRLYNVLATKLCIDELLLVYESGIEIVAGSGITIPRVISINDLPRTFSIFEWENLPFQCVFDEEEEEFKESYWAYWSTVLISFIDLFEKEYFRSAAGGVAPSSNEVTPPLPTSQAFLNLRKKLGSAAYDKTSTLEQLESKLAGVITQITDELVRVVDESDLGTHVLKHDQLRVASPGLYVDSLIGMKPATEPYAEEMRAQTVAMKAAEAARERSMAAYYSNLAGPRVERPVAGHATATLKEHTLLFRMPLPVPGGTWSFIVDGDRSGTITVLPNQQVGQLTYTSLPSWVSEPEGHVLMLLHEDSNHALFVVLVR